MDLDPAKGAVYGITAPVAVSTRDGERVTSAPVNFYPSNGATLRVELAGLHLRLTPPPGASSVRLCSIVHGKEARQAQIQYVLAVGLLQQRGVGPSSCRRMTRPLDVRAVPGAVYGIRTPVSVVLRDGKDVSKPIVFDPAKGRQLSNRIDGVVLRFTPAPGASSFTFCRGPLTKSERSAGGG
jgi:hypothetical protein